MRRVSVVATVTAAVLAFASAPAIAGDGTSWVTCGRRPQPGCNVHAGTHGHRASSDSGRASSGHASGPCRNRQGSIIACNDPGLGSVGGDGCYYQPAPAPGGRQHPSGSGGWYRRTCTHRQGQSAEGLGTVRWVPGAPAAAPSPAQVARSASARLALPSPLIATNPLPDADSLVGVPVWLWLRAGSWRSRSAAASVPGVRVKATATPARVSWRMGDGSTVSCDGPGTAWRDGADPMAASPDCGHTYRVASDGQPGGRYTVTATIWWSVSWAGAGRSGTLPELSTSDSVRLRVGESQAVNGTAALSPGTEGRR